VGRDADLDWLLQQSVIPLKSAGGVASAGPRRCWRYHWTWAALAKPRLARAFAKSLLSDRFPGGILWADLEHPSEMSVSAAPAMNPRPCSIRRVLETWEGQLAAQPSERTQSRHHCRAAIMPSTITNRSSARGPMLRGDVDNVDSLDVLRVRGVGRRLGRRC
jgi:hypothetical protein